MKFSSSLDELEHWLQRLDLELRLGSERRHVLSVARLCEVFVERVGRDKRIFRPDDLDHRMTLSVRWLDLQRKVSAGHEPAKPNPAARKRGGLRVIDGGRQ